MTAAVRTFFARPADLRRTASVTLFAVGQRVRWYAGQPGHFRSGIVSGFAGALVLIVSRAIEYRVAHGLIEAT